MIAAKEAQERDDDDADGEDDADGDDDADDGDGDGDEGDEERDEADESGEGDDDDDGEEPANIRDRNRRLRAAAAARRRRARKKESQAAAAVGLDAGEMVDDVFTRTTHTVTTFVRKNFKILQWGIIVLVVGGIGWQVYSWKTNKKLAQTSDQLFAGIEAESGRLGAPEDEGKPNEDGIVDPTPIYRTAEERLKAAEKAYRDAAAAKKTPSTVALATLGLAGVQYDQGKFKEAHGSFAEVAASELAKQDIDVRGRALEGAAMSLEAAKDLPGALNGFKQLEGVDAPRFKRLAKFHQARVLIAQDKKDEAKKILVELREKLTKNDKGETDPLAMLSGPRSYLNRSVDDLLRSIDPSAVPATGMPPGGLDPAALQRMIEQFKKKGPPPGAPGAPSPKPSGG